MTPGEEVEGCDSGARRERGPWHPRAPPAQRHLEGTKLGLGSQESLGLPPCSADAGPLGGPVQGWTVAGGPQGPNSQSSLRLTFLIRARGGNIGLWGPGTGLESFVRFVPSFPVNMFPCHKRINLLSFPESEKRAFVPRWAWSVSFRPRSHQLLSGVLGSRGLRPRPGGRGAGRVGHEDTAGADAATAVTTEPGLWARRAGAPLPSVGCGT